MDAHFSKDAHGRSWTLIFGWTLMDAHGRSWTLMDAHGRFSDDFRTLVGGRKPDASRTILDDLGRSENLVTRRSRSRFRFIRNTANGIIDYHVLITLMEHDIYNKMIFSKYYSLNSTFNLGSQSYHQKQQKSMPLTNFFGAQSVKKMNWNLLLCHEFTPGSNTIINLKIKHFFNI
jgi:hypothetical protein